jgi:hypothetical protein
MHFKFIWQLLNLPIVDEILASQIGKTITSTAVVTSASPDATIDDSSMNNLELMFNTLSQLIGLSLQFNIEVVARAKAKNCVLTFFEQMEDIILGDVTRKSAEYIVSELALDGFEQKYLNHLNPIFNLPAAPSSNPSSRNVSTDQKSGPVSIHTSTTISPEKNAYATPAKTSGKQTLTSQTSLRAHMVEFNYIQKTCHSWLVQIYFLCPIPSTIKGFSRFLFNCIKVLQASQSPYYLKKDDKMNDSFDESLPESSQSYQTGPVTPPDIKSPITQSAGKQSSNSNIGSPLGSDFNIQDSSMFNNCVTRFLNKILILTEKMSSEYVVGREG